MVMARVRSMPFASLPSGKGTYPDGGYQLEISGPDEGILWVLDQLQALPWIDSATHSLHIQFAGRVTDTNRLVFCALTISQRYEKWIPEGHVWSVDATSSAGRLSAWDDGLIVFCCIRLFLSLRKLLSDSGAVNHAAFALECFGFGLLCSTFVLQDRGLRQLQAILRAENSTDVAQDFVGYGFEMHYVGQWHITLGLTCLFTWTAVSWRLTRPGRSTWALVSCALMLVAPVVGFCVASRVWNGASVWEEWVTFCQVLVRDSSYLHTNPVRGNHDSWEVAAKLLFRYVGSAALIAVAISVFLDEGLHDLNARSWLERFVNDVPPTDPAEEKAAEQEAAVLKASARKFPTAQQRSLLLSLIRPVHSVPRKHLRMLRHHDKFKGLNIPDPARVQKEMDKIVGEDVRDDMRRKKLISAMDHRMAKVLRAFQQLDGQCPDNDVERLDTADSTRPRTAAAAKATKKIERGLLWVLEHGNWFST